MHDRGLSEPEYRLQDEPDTATDDEAAAEDDSATGDPSDPALDDSDSSSEDDSATEDDAGSAADDESDDASDAGSAEASASALEHEAGLTEVPSDECETVPPSEEAAEADVTVADLTASPTIGPSPVEASSTEVGGVDEEHDEVLWLGAVSETGRLPEVRARRGTAVSELEPPLELTPQVAAAGVAQLVLDLTAPDAAVLTDPLRLEAVLGRVAAGGSVRLVAQGHEATSLLRGLLADWPAGWTLDDLDAADGGLRATIRREDGAAVTSVATAVWATADVLAVDSRRRELEAAATARRLALRHRELLAAVKREREALRREAQLLDEVAALRQLVRKAPKRGPVRRGLRRLARTGLLRSVAAWFGGMIEWLRRLVSPRSGKPTAGPPSTEPLDDVMALPTPLRRHRRLRQRRLVVDRLAAELAGDGPPDDPGAWLEPGVSVVIPSFEGAAHLGACLESLGRQTLDPDLFEVIVVLNGSPDGSRALVDAFSREHPSIDIQLVELADRAGVGVARNAGISQARRQFMSLLDDDDTVSPAYLEVLLRNARWDVVPLAGLVDVEPDGTIDEATPFNRVLDRHAGKIVEARSAASLLSLNACKLLPTELVQRVGYDTELRSGVDVEFLVALYAEGRFRLHALPRSEGATYYRSLRPGSVSRRAYDFEFSVEGRLDVIQKIAPHAMSSHPGTSVVARTIAGAQAGFMRRYLEEAPDEHEAVLAAIRRRNLPWFPYAALNRDRARRLVVSYCFTPYAGPSAMVSAKRIQQRGEIVDVLQNAMDEVRAIDRGTDALAEEYIDRKVVLETRTLFGSWAAIREFCEESRLTVAKLTERKEARYTSMHSRAMWPASHFAAALLKLDDPSVHWSAEFSDPVSHDVHGALRRGMVRDDPISRELLNAMPASFGGYDLTLFQWCEQIAYHLADELVFTNPNQLQVMLETCPPAMREAVRAKAVIDPQPAPLARFYDVAEVEQIADQDRTSIAYFGSFYATRGLGEVFTALADLTSEERDRLRLDVFTGSTSVVLDAIRDQPWADVVRVHEYRPYLEFLALTTQYDALLVNDAETSSVHSVNPYLPSKYSDYRGSGTPIWGHVEPGSVLSQEPLQFVSTIGDLGSIRAVLTSLADRTPQPGAALASQPE